MVTAPTVAEQVRIEFDANLSDLNRGISAVNGKLQDFKSAVIGLLPAVSVGTALAAFRNSLDATAATLDRMVDLNISEDLFKGLELGAQASGISIGTLDSALSRFNRRVARLSQGQGTLFSSLTKTNPELVKQLATATSLDEQLKLFANTIGNTKDQQEQLRLVSAAFGNEGEKLIRLLKDGTITMEDFTTQAKSLGLVMGEDTLVAAAELSSELDKMQGIVGTQLRNAFAEAAVTMAEFFGLFETRRVATIDAELKEVTRTIELGAKRISDIRADASIFSSEESTNKQVASIADQISLLKIQEAGLREERERAEERLKSYTDTNNKHRTSVVSLGKDQSRLGEGVTEVTRALSDQEKQMLTLSDRFSSHVSNAFADLATKGKINFKSLADSVVADLTRMITKQIIFNTVSGFLTGGTSTIASGGGLLSGIGALFGGFFADGGRVQAGKFNVVGENGPELFRPDVNGTIIPNDQMSNQRSNSGTKVIRLQGLGRDKTYTSSELRILIKEIGKESRDMGLEFRLAT